MSSHREAPEISKDPVADSTDLYAFVSSGNPDNVTIIANYVPLQSPAGGPNFFEFGDDVLYEINVDNNGDGKADVTYQFTFKTEVTQPGHVPLQHRPDPVARPTRTGTGARRTRSTAGRRRTARRPDARQRPAVPAVQHRAAVDAELRDAGHGRRPQLDGGGKVFAGQRAEGFYVDLGAIFDLAILRPFQQPARRSVSRPPGWRGPRRSNATEGRQRALDRDPGAEDDAHAGRQRRRPTPPRRHR